MQPEIPDIKRIAVVMRNDSKLNRMKELVPILDEASKAYYQQDEEIMSNFEYDRLYDELVALEEELGIVLSGSPTVKVGYEAATSLPKERHAFPMLSLGKTKDREELRSWLQGQKALLSWKLDGLTVVLEYSEGKLVKAVTRGNGEIGEVITANAKCFSNVPTQIPFTGSLTLRGEAVISYEDFEKINEQISDPAEKYKNPRNLCSGSVRQLDPKVTKERNVSFIAFALVSAEGYEFNNSRESQFDFLKAQGFSVVEYRTVNEDSILEAISYFEKAIVDNEYPSDGLVLLYDDIAYGDSLGRTAKFPRNAIAFKWADEIAETNLLEIEWSPSRTGLINPVAIFSPVELEGTTVSRASVHNISIVKNLCLGIGDRITVYKANMIIPQIADNLTRSNNIDIPEFCPACGGRTTINKQNETETLMCENEDCPAKQIKSFSLFVSRNAMNIEGMSEQTLEKFLARGFIREYADIYKLDRFEQQIVDMDGFGLKSYENIISSIEASRETTMQRFLYSLGIPGFGVQNAKIISRHYDEDFELITKAGEDELSAIDGIGPVMAADFVKYFSNERNCLKAQRVFQMLRIVKANKINMESSIAGKVFVVTGSVEHFENRNELKAFIEERGGKVTGSVTSKTDYLINNDVTSNSSKNKKAKELEIPILSEEDFMNLVNE